MQIQVRFLCLAHTLCTLIRPLAFKRDLKLGKKKISKLYMVLLEAISSLTSSQVSFHSKLSISDQCIPKISLRKRKETSFPIPISEIEKQARWTGLPKEYLSPDTPLRNIFLLFSFKATGERKKGKSWKLIVFHLRGFCINMRLCKMWGSNERHFLLWATTSFEKN